jgi:hypothetical protein
MNNKDFEPIRIRIMQETYELADRGDVEGYNSVKVMCNDVQNLLRREWVWLNEEEVNAIYAKIEEKVSKHWNDGGTTMMFPETLYEAFEAKLKDKNT